MKIFKLFFLSVLVSTMVACSSDDDNSNDNDGNGNTSGELAATWVGETVNYHGTSVTEAQGQTITSDFVGIGYDVDYTLTFSENPNLTSSTGSYSVEVTTTTLGQSITQDIENLTWSNVGEWSRIDDEVSFTLNGQTDSMTITEITETTLVMNGVTVQEVNQGGITSTSTTDITVSFTKQ